MVTTRGSKRKEVPAEAPPPAPAPKAKAKSTPRKAIQAKKVKNKVGSPPIRSPRGKTPSINEEDVDSDDFNFNDEEDSVSVAGNQDVASDADSAASLRVRLPANLQRQLLTDIQARGGIQKFGLEAEQALSILCDQRPELYGERGHRVRKRIGKKVQRWKSLSTTEYLGLLVKFGVTEKPSKAVTKRLVVDQEEKLQEDQKPAARESLEVEDQVPTVVEKQTLIPSVVTVRSAASVASTSSKMSVSGNTSKLSGLIFFVSFCACSALTNLFSYDPCKHSQSRGEWSIPCL